MRKWRADWEKVDVYKRMATIIDTLAAEGIKLRPNLAVFSLRFCCAASKRCRMGAVVFHTKAPKDVFAFDYGARKLVGLALLAVNRDIMVSPQELWGRFMSAPNRRLLG